MYLAGEVHRMSIALADATDEQIAAELERRSEVARLAEIERNATWNQVNAELLLAITTHNPEAMLVRSPGHTWGSGGGRESVLCSDEDPRSSVGRCARCGVLRMIRSEEWSNYIFTVETRGVYRGGGREPGPACR